jgi:MOSC domain-containing protein YiiM
MAFVYSISIAPERGQFKTPVEKATFIENLGIDGDGHRGDWGRQVTCLNRQSVERVNAEKGLQIGPGQYAENVCISGMEELDLQVGDRFSLGEDVVLEVTQIGKPDHPSVVTKAYGVSLLPSEGRFCRVIRGGEVCTGDPVTKL